MRENQPLVILGAGISGLSAGYTLSQAGEPHQIFEAGSRAGGLMDNFTIDGFRFDNAVHLSFATEPDVRKIFDQTDYLIHPPKSECYDDGTWLPHPIQNNTFRLPAEDRAELITSFINRPSIEINNYRDWLIFQYGNYIAERWPLRYTKKYWTISAEDMGIDWIGHRMRRADLSEILLGALSEKRPDYYYAKEMRYPKKGGYRAFLNPLLKTETVNIGHRAVKIDIYKRVVTFSNNRIVQYDKLISTIPLPELIKILVNVPLSVRTAADSLFSTEIDLISIGFSKKINIPSMWFYIYNEAIFASRAYAPHLKSSDNVPVGCSALQFEIYSSKRNNQAYSPEEMKENTIRAVERLGIAKSSDICMLHHKHIPYGNVVFDLGMEGRRKIVLDWLSEIGIYTAGRFGEWDYLWSNQSFMSGMQAAHRALRLDTI